MQTAAFNGTQQIIDIPGTGGAFLPLLATGPVRRVEITESQTTAAGANNPPQGFAYEILNDNSPLGNAQPFVVSPYNTAVLGDPQVPGSRWGSTIGNGSSFLIGIGATPATTLCKLRSASATGTSVIVRQYY